jgi:DNA-binding NtrC family response regulator
VAAAEGGTLFLDEVGELPLSMQVKLLRLLQQREYTPVGESRSMKADVRIVAATNRNLAREVEAGRFREDLYYRLNVIHVRLPALRERREDIPLLAQHFLRAAAERDGRADVMDFSAEATARLVACDWPGNVRELENVVERAVLLSPGATVTEDCIIGTYASRAPARPVSIAPVVVAIASRIPSDLEELEHDILGSAGAIDLRAKVDAYENTLIRDALARHGNNKTKAAQSLGLHRTTLVEMLKRKRIEPLPRAA